MNEYSVITMLWTIIMNAYSVVTMAWTNNNERI